MGLRLDQLVDASNAFRQHHFLSMTLHPYQYLNWPAAQDGLNEHRGLGLIVVDYLQLLTPELGEKPENRVQEISNISRGLKSIAKDLNVPVLALSQLSRAVECVKTNGQIWPICASLDQLNKMQMWLCLFIAKNIT